MDGWIGEQWVVRVWRQDEDSTVAMSLFGTSWKSDAFVVVELPDHSKRKAP